jgi:hypothetical protein
MEIETNEFDNIMDKKPNQISSIWENFGKGKALASPQQCPHQTIISPILQATVKPIQKKRRTFH